MKIIASMYSGVNSGDSSQYYMGIRTLDGVLVETGTIHGYGKYDRYECVPYSIKDRTELATVIAMGVDSEPIYHVTYGHFCGFLYKQTFDELYKRVGEIIESREVK